MNGVIAGVVASVLILIGAVIGVVSSNQWTTTQQGLSQNVAGTSITQAESTMNGTNGTTS